MCECVGPGERIAGVGVTPKSYLGKFRSASSNVCPGSGWEIEHTEFLLSFAVGRVASMWETSYCSDETPSKGAGLLAKGCRADQGLCKG